MNFLFTIYSCTFENSPYSPEFYKNPLLSLSFLRVKRVASEFKVNQPGETHEKDRKRDRNRENISIDKIKRTLRL